LVICTREQLTEQIGLAEHKLLQSIRYRLAMASRRLHQQGVERASAVLHRNIGRLQQRVDELEYRLRERIGASASVRRKRLEELTARLRSLDLRLRFAAARRRLETAETSALQLMRLRLTRSRGRLDPLLAHLTQLSPLKILERGYAIVTREAGQIVKQPGQATVGSEIKVRLAKGGLDAKVTLHTENGGSP
jgi:exodeoxyribonuclease VII large subunit